MRRLLSGWLAILLPLISLPVSAEVLVLVHGYQSHPSIWHQSGVIPELQRQGWHDAGNYILLGIGPQRMGPPIDAGDKSLVTLSLPSEAPLDYQARILDQYLLRIGADFPDHDIILIGHSAGGVVARYLLVMRPIKGVSALITIASPHLGTAAAEMAALAGDSPLGYAAPLVGLNTVHRSRGLYNDLVRARPGTLLHWLNHQTHPDIRWISLVRRADSIGSGRFIVPAFSQDLRHVAALGGRVLSYSVPGGHELDALDGALLGDILNTRLLKQQD